MSDLSPHEFFNHSSASYKYITTLKEAKFYLEIVREAALDIETTSLHPEEGGKIRLIQITNDDMHIVIDVFAIGGIQTILKYLIRPNVKWWVYNAKFETKWIDFYDETQATNVWDVDFVWKAVMGGRPSSLAIIVKYTFRLTLSKEQQNSGWHQPELSLEQLNYAAFDSYITWELKKHWWDGRANEGHRWGAEIMNSSVRATITSEKYGLVLDPVYHKKVVDVWQMKFDTFHRFLRRYTGEGVIKNLNSKQQISKFLSRELPKALLDVWPRTDSGIWLKQENDTLKDASRKLGGPMGRWLAALAGYNYYAKYLSTYGVKLINHQNTKGFIPTRTNIGQAKTCRESSSQENLQNIPRQIYVRRSFSIAAPNSLLVNDLGGPIVGTKVMTLADYAGVEVRVLAEVSGDKQLLEDCIYGDVHGASAAQIFGYDVDYVMEVLASKGTGKYANIYPIIKEQRGKAKGFTFQLTYGAGAEALSFVLKCTTEEAEEAIRKWAERYPDAYEYRNKMFKIMQDTGYLPVVDGRTIYIAKGNRNMPIAANYPIQGAAASVMYRAKYHCHRLFHEQRHRFEAYVAASVHDEVLGYADESHAEEAMDLQLEGMRLGWLDIFPNTNTDNLTDHAIGLNWSAKP